MTARPLIEHAKRRTSMVPVTVRVDYNQQNPGAHGFDRYGEPTTLAKARTWVMCPDTFAQLTRDVHDYEAELARTELP